MVEHKYNLLNDIKQKAYQQAIQFQFYLKPG